MKSFVLPFPPSSAICWSGNVTYRVLWPTTEKHHTHLTYYSLVYVWDNYLSQAQGPATCKMCSQTQESL